MKIKSKFDYKNLLSYLTVLCLFLIFCSVEKDIYPYPIAVYGALLYVGASPFITPILLILSFLVIGKTGLILSVSISAFSLSLVFLFYKRFDFKVRYELSVYVLLSMIGYIFLGDTKVITIIDKRILVSVFTAILSFILQISFKAIISKGLRFKLNYEELATIFVSVAVIGLGVSNSLSPEVWKGLSAFLILMFSYLYRKGACTLIASVLGLSLSLYFGKIEYVSVFLVWSIFAQCFMPISRFISAGSIVFSDFLVFAIFGIYPEYTYIQVLAISLGCLAFTLIPLRRLIKMKEKLYTFREKQLVRKSINQNRLMTSNRLFRLANVFMEMKEAFITFKKQGTSVEKTKELIESKIAKEVCINCDNKERCKQNKCPKKSDLSKLIDIGFAKGKLSLIDMNKDMLNTCVHPNNILFFLNKTLADYRRRELEHLNYSKERELLANEAQGVADILKRLALDTGTTLKYHNRLERTLADNLFKKGFLVSEILIYGEEEKISVSMIVLMKEFSLEAINQIVDNTLQIQTVLTEKADVTQDKCYLSFRKSPEFDAVFGVSAVTKDGSMFSGDTHSVLRLSEDKFLIALSDGMGSGENAQNLSSASLSLIESFYKAGLESSLILNTVNKLLAINCEDNFTALDVSVIDLKTCRADFIKYGSPYGFVVNPTGIRIIEGNTLPLGILEDLSPSVCSLNLNEGDIILLISDGISDAFGCSGDIIEYLKTVPALNPKSLSDGILEKAISLCGGSHKDDMTALAVRIIKNHKAV